MLHPYRTLGVKNRKRDKIVLIADMLQRATMGVKKTELMYHVGLSTTQFCNYVPELLKSELMERVDSKYGLVYKTTFKGKEFLNTFETLSTLLERSTPHPLRG